MIKAKKKVSIIIPNYNGEKYISDCLESVLAQNYKSIEIIVVDDGSKDNSVKFISKYRSSSIIIKQKNQGGAVARNRGLEMATGDYVLFLDSDDVLNPSAVSELVNRIEIDDSDIALGGFTEVDEKGSFRKEIDIANEDRCIAKDDLIPELSMFLPVPSSKLYKMSLIKKYGVYWDNVRIGQDLNFYLKYLLHCKKASILKNSIFNYRIRHNSISRSYDLRIFDIANSFAGVKKYYGDNDAEEIYLNYLSVLELKHYNTQLSKLIYYPNKSIRKLIVYYFKVCSHSIRYDKCKNFDIRFRKLRVKYFLKCHLQFIVTSNIYRYLMMRRHNNRIHT